MSETLYRKYRPKNFNTLAGQEHVKLIFEKAIELNRVSNAYVFSGPRGTGKTTVARILAKRLNCNNPEGFEPCNKCDQCSAVEKGSHLDVIEMDAASNRGIDDFRAIREKIEYKPLQGKRKIYIIDEVHMLTNEAFNSILKMLEEPPPDVYFILATTNAEKIPDTILSRCQIIPFKNLSEAEIKTFLLGVAGFEEINIEEKAVEYISKKSKGGMRDALVLLEQSARMKSPGEKIEVSDVLKIAGGASQESLSSFLNAVMKIDFERILNQVETIFLEGTNIEVFLEELISYILEFADEREYFFQILPLAAKASELLRELKYVEDKKSVFAAEILNFSMNLQENGMKELKQNITETDKKSVKDEEKNETPSNATDEFQRKIESKKVEVYYALKSLGFLFKDGILRISMNHEKSIASQILLDNEEFLKEEAKELSFSVVIEKKDNQKSEIISEDMKKVYERLKLIFPDEKIIVEDQ